MPVKWEVPLRIWPLVKEYFILLFSAKVLISVVWHSAPMDVLSGFTLMTDPSLGGFVSRDDDSRMSCMGSLHFSGIVRVQLSENLVGPALSLMGSVLFLMGIHGSDVGENIIISAVSKPNPILN